MGDLNEILHSNEKLGGRSLGSTSGNYLENFLFEYGSSNLGFIGNTRTLRNNRHAMQHIE